MRSCLISALVCDICKISLVFLWYFYDWKNVWKLSKWFSSSSTTYISLRMAMWQISLLLKKYFSFKNSPFSFDVNYIYFLFYLFIEINFVMYLFLQRTIHSFFMQVLGLYFLVSDFTIKGRKSVRKNRALITQIKFCLFIDPFCHIPCKCFF